MNTRHLFATAATLAVVALLAACGAAKSPSEINLSAAQAKYPGYGTDAFTAGQTLYTANCGRCHPAHTPSSHTEEQWAKWVPKMVTMANKNAQTVVIDESGQELILKFLYAASH